MLAEGSGGVYSHPAGTTDGRDGDHFRTTGMSLVNQGGWLACSFPVPVHLPRQLTSA
jgi:hypothetical protein